MQTQLQETYTGSSLENLKNANIWGDDFADMQLISKYNKWIRFLLYAIDMHNKYAGLIPLIDKKSITITTTFQKIWGNFGLKQNKIRIDQDNEFYYKPIKLWQWHWNVFNTQQREICSC